jgi:hypothetical protein
MRIAARNRGPGVPASRLIALTTLILALAFAADANATTWFAAPDGDGPAPCHVTDPCEIHDAVGDAPAGSRVAALAGIYELTSVLHVADAIALQGPWSGPPAVMVGDGDSGPAIRATGAGTRATNLTIEQSSYGTGIEIGNGALGDRLRATTSGSGAACAPVLGGLLRDSLCISHGGGNGILVDEDDGAAGVAEVTNVTAVSFGDGGTAAALLVRAQGGANIDVNATNVIAVSQGDAPDVAAGALIGSSSAHLVLASSNYGEPANAGGDTTITPPGTNGNQTAEPVFIDSAGGDYAEAPSSPTIDAGTASAPSLGLLDLVRIARIRGSAPDIGAYEYVPPPDTQAPNVSIVKAPKGKIKTRKRFVRVGFELASDEPDVSFTCRINRLPVESCSSPVSYRLRATKGVGSSYKLTVRATDAAGNRSGKAIREVQLIRKRR